MTKLLQVLSLVPALMALIAAVEEMFPQAGKGAEKLAMVKEILTAAYASIQESMPLVERLIAIIVAAANRMGAFKTAADPGK